MRTRSKIGPETTRLTAADVDEILSAAGRNSPRRSAASVEIRDLLASLADDETKRRQGPPLAKLCRAGVIHAWRRLESERADLLVQLSSRAKASLRRHLQRTLEKITRSSFELEWTSFTLAVRSLGFARNGNAGETEVLFFRQGTAHRLGSLFRKFPALAHLWVLAIGQWRDQVIEILIRVRKDRAAVSRLFVEPDVTRKIKDLRLGLSDAHQRGRSVALIEFCRGGRVIYKPRPGGNESAWFFLLGWMNRQGFQPEQRLMQVLVAKEYSWMEYAEAAPCASAAAVRRFYERLGGLIAAAYLLKAVDCHRENLIAAGEHPILLDLDALWHVSPVTKTQSVTDVLYRTGFFPNARRGSLQSRSSVLGRSSRGSHLPRIAGEPIPPGPYAKEIISGFTRGWHCLVGNPKRRAAFNRMAGRIRSGQRRWIYLATAKYAAIVRASLGPAVMRSVAERDALIRHFCSRTGVSKTVIQAETTALGELNIPYFKRRTRERMPRDPNQAPSELVVAIRKALEWTEPVTRLSKGNRCTSGNLQPGAPRRSRGPAE